MCGRFSQSKKHDQAISDIAGLIGAITIDEWPVAAFEAAAGRYNIRPSTRCLILRGGQTPVSAPILTLSRWGYRPGWMDDDYIRQSKRGPFINARAETVFEARAFANAVRYNRCLILADGFYEPKGGDKIGGTRQKREQHHFALPGRRLFALAGIEAAYPAGDIVGDAANFAILTCAPNDQVAPIHKRMPVIVPDTDWSLWLGGSGVDPAVLNTLLQPWSGSAPKGVLNSNQVSPAINKQDAEGPWCIDPYTSPAEASAQAVASNAKQGSLF